MSPDELKGPIVVLASGAGSSHKFGVYVYDQYGELVFTHVAEADADALALTTTASGGTRLPRFVVGVRNQLIEFCPPP